MTTQTPPPDTVGPYQIDDLLGVGGMGEVYKAYDPRLDRWVAVKHIRPEFAKNAGYRKRLEREARTVAALDHPAIVQIFDVIRSDDGGEWIIMEFVDGPTVFDMLDPGPLELGTALTIGLDVIHGLAQAHGRGVLHRDLKSENVMVSRSSGAAKILDFGLAKRVTAVDEASISVEGRVIGTCRVMSPEQANGLELDGRADLFAFGILLYEMVTAFSPFRASTPMASMLKAFSEPHRPLHDYDPDLPSALVALIDQLLKKNRNDRPPNAEAVAARLAEIAATVAEDPTKLAERIRRTSRSWPGLDSDSRVEEPHDPLDDTVPGGGPVGRIEATSDSRAQASLAASDVMARTPSKGPRIATVSVAPAPRQWSRMLSFALGMGVSRSLRVLTWCAWLLVGLAVWWGVRSMTEPMAQSVPENARIMVLPFENHGREEMSYFASGLTSELIRELTRRRGLAVVSYKTSTYYGSGDRSLREVGEELNIDYVIEGSVAARSSGAENRSLEITSSLIRLSDGQILLSRSQDRPFEDMLQAQSEIADDVALELGAQILADRYQDADPLALEAYYRGVSLLYGSALEVSQVPETERLLEFAVDRDPSLVRAWTELARIRSWMYFNRIGDPEQKFRAATAVNQAKELAPDTPSVILADGYYHYYVLEDFEAARREFEEVAELTPNDPAAPEAIGYILRRQGRLAESIRSFEQAFDLDRANGTLIGALAETERALRRYDRAEDWFALATRVSPGSTRVLGDRAENALARFGCGGLNGPSGCDVTRARKILLHSETSDSSDAWQYFVDLAWYEMGSKGESDQFLRVYDGVNRPGPGNRSEHFEFWKKILVFQRLGQAREATEMAARVERELTEVTANVDGWFYTAPLSMALALQGKDAKAQQQMELAFEDAAQDPFTGPRVNKWAAMVAIVSGRNDQALAHLWTAAQQTYQRSLASYELQSDPIWQPLRDGGELDEIWAYLRGLEGRSGDAR